MQASQHVQPGFLRTRVVEHKPPVRLDERPHGPVAPPGFVLLLGADGAQLLGADGAPLYGVL